MDELLERSRLLHREWCILSAEQALLGLLTRRWTEGLTTDQIYRAVVAGRAGPHARDAARTAGSLPSDVVVRSDPRFPTVMRELDRPPYGLWMRGDVGLLADQVRVGIIGSRHPRSDAALVARSIASSLARRGIPIVSGLAIGIDGAAHMGALDAGGQTIAVLGGGFNRLHPRRHRDLARRMAERGGLLVSEYEPDADAFPYRFRERNRLIAALSTVLVVVQARPASGSMITAQNALDLGLDVGVVPSYVGDSAFEGSHQLLRDGSPAVVDAESVLRMLGMEPGTSAAHHQFGTVLDAPRTAFELAELLAIPLPEVCAELTQLETCGLLVRTDDGRYVNAGVR
jgi:DNA processing protein